MINRLIRRGAHGVLRPFSFAARQCFGAVTSVRTDRPVAALTFDDGPDSETTPALLSVLEKHDARATFFMIGELAQAHPEAVKQVVQAGHAIGNHSWSHLSFPLLSSRERREQLRAAQRALEPYGQKLFRPPYCHQSVHSRWDTLCEGYDVIAFSVHAEDWLQRDPAWMTRVLLDRIRPGSIIILHDNIYRSILPVAQHDRRAMLIALDRMLEELRGRMQFLTVPELLCEGPAIRENWYRQASGDLRPALNQYLAQQRQESLGNQLGEN